LGKSTDDLHKELSHNTRVTNTSWWTEPRPLKVPKRPNALEHVDALKSQIMESHLYPEKPGTHTTSK